MPAASWLVKNRSVRPPGEFGWPGEVQPLAPRAAAEATATGRTESAVMTARRPGPLAGTPTAVAGSPADPGDVLAGTVNPSQRRLVSGRRWRTRRTFGENHLV